MTNDDIFRCINICQDTDVCWGGNVYGCYGDLNNFEKNQSNLACLLLYSISLHPLYCATCLFVYFFLKLLEMFVGGTEINKDPDTVAQHLSMKQHEW